MPVGAIVVTSMFFMINFKLHTHKYTYIYVCVCVCVWVSVCVSECVCVCVCVTSKYTLESIDVNWNKNP